MNGANYDIEILWRTQRLNSCFTEVEFQSTNICFWEIYEVLLLSKIFHDNPKSTITHKPHLGVLENTSVIFLPSPVPKVKAKCNVKNKGQLSVDGSVQNSVVRFTALFSR